MIECIRLLEEIMRASATLLLSGTVAITCYLGDAMHLNTS